MIRHGAQLPPIVGSVPPQGRKDPPRIPALVRAHAGCKLGAAALALLAIGISPARAQAPLAPTSPTVTCPTGGEDLLMPPELVRTPDGILKGTINLTEEQQRIWTSALNTGVVTCAPQWVRIFRGQDLPLPLKAQPESNFADPLPGPTLRAKVGDLVQLTFVNQVNSNRFDRNIDREACMDVVSPGVAGGKIYPGLAKDSYPNCLHASSTANIHFHGTHTNPNSTGDNVYLQIRPLPRDNQGNLTTTPAAASVSLQNFFDKCTEVLKNPVTSWPVTWSDLTQAGAKPYVDMQTQLLQAYQAQNPDQKLWDEDKKVLDAGGWPQYYIGVVPYCYALPTYTAASWPPPAGSTSPNMGQSPGTHWYHAHKHGSTAINVANGMTGAFIIEGQYDEDLNTAYGSYQLQGGKRWSARAQPVMVLNTLGTTPNLLSPVHTGQGFVGIEFSVNGRRRPKVQMQPGEVQLWRIVNTSGRNAIYFMAPDGFEWRQLAQDGVQFADSNYQNSLNRPFYLAPANRADLLVKAPAQPTAAEVRVQNVMGRFDVKPTPLNPTATDPKPGTVLMTVNVSGPQVTLDGQPAQMPFLPKAPTQPPFLTDITDQELRSSGYGTKTFSFNSKAPRAAIQHTINGIQWEHQDAHVEVHLGKVEEWTIKNETNKDGSAASGGGGGPGGAPPQGIIDHPFHIHINPFQVTEFFDPNENLTNPNTGQLLGVLQGGKTLPVPKYVLKGAPITDSRQCVLDPDDPSTWMPCQKEKGKDLVWWDVFAIPSARSETKKDGTKATIPGYYKMRSRFVDYPGLYVFHCHILIHEDRGMMFSMEVVKPAPKLMKHH